MPTLAWGRAITRPMVLSCLFIWMLAFPGILHANTIIIGEINWAGSSRSTADEWLELWNLSSSTQTLSGWSLTGAGREAIVFNDTHVIPAFSAFLISNYAADHPGSALNIAPHLVTPAVSLSNQGFHLALLDQPGDTADEIYSPPELIRPTDPVRSLVRTLAASTVATSSAWIISTTSTNLDGDVNDVGTPGICDGCPLNELMAVSLSPTASETSTSSLAILEAFVADLTTTPATTTILATDHTSSTEATPDLANQYVTDTEALVGWHTSSTPLDSTVNTSTPSFDPNITTSTSVSTSTGLTFSSSTPPSTGATLAEDLLRAHASIYAEATSSSPAATPAPCNWHLAVIAPAPSHGAEWLALDGCQHPEQAYNWSIHDDQGKILLIQSSTTIMQDNDRFQIWLPGQHLRNSGDTVMLRGPDHRLYDIVSYPALKHDERYERHADGSWWIPNRITLAHDTPTASAHRILVATTSTPSLVIPPPASPIALTSVPKRGPATPPVISMSYAEYLGIQNSQPVHASVVVKQKPTKTRNMPAPSTTPSTAPKPIRPKKPQPSPSTKSVAHPFAPHVLLRGTVGTPPSLIGKHAFVLLNPAGQGILVKGNAKQPSPPLAATVEVSGQLITNDDGTRLEMKTKDLWRLADLSESPDSIANVSVSDLGRDDNWSLVEVNGIVRDSQANRIHLVTSDTDLTVIIKPSLDYRAGRIKPGDEISVRGVIDLKPDTPRLYPRTATDIVLVKRATSELAKPSTASDQMPPWIPIATAGTTIAAAHGLRRAYVWHQQKRLERDLSTAVTALASPAD